uniref:Uncharacterized protein K02A2.6-like n=1 Tax=Saccoglossus kowalevskii TaxID=10224 RepID=A0ABM0LZY3_SACKO|nr:PREDICTED: uncharacterized protein K02A2.6-like [Saccoglossus kowalevskii]
MRDRVLQILHKQHKGIEKNTPQRQSVYWPGLNANIDYMIKDCNQCQTYQRSQSKLPVQIIYSTEAINMVGLDIFEFDGSQYLLIVGYYAGYFGAYTLHNMTSSTVISKIDEIFSIFGYPTDLISDNGPQLTSSKFQEYCQTYEIRHTTSAPHHQQAYGCAESKNIHSASG